jgi:hypothetical protein
MVEDLGLSRDSRGMLLEHVKDVLADFGEFTLDLPITLDHSLSAQRRRLFSAIHHWHQ